LSWPSADGALKPSHQSLAETKRTLCDLLGRGIVSGGQTHADAAAAYPSAVLKYAQNCKENLSGFAKPGKTSAVHLEAALFVQLVEVCFCAAFSPS
jgi:hypothetical protein